MVVGDVVSDVGVINTSVDFQPAAGVEGVMTCVTQGNTANFAISLRTSAGLNSLMASTVAQMAYDFMNTKVFVTNGVFVRISAIVAVSIGFTGMEIG